ncbi:MAG: penicillin-binding protein [Rhodocyclaceae bacterium]|nr:penicillin-binding protein [Rhodocyclaceae bacterium]MCP5233980.1 penicillin-binding protein [Zoogloeaceae bacterium]MCP5237018.1 penicillin-binding protein [Zoogloeaceae bacterium]
MIEPEPFPESERRRRPAVTASLLLLFSFAVLAALAGIVELRTSWVQSELLPGYASTLTWQVESGPSEQIVFPREGPYDARLGFSLLPQFSQRLGKHGYRVDRQAQFAPALMNFAREGYFPPYREKMQTGLAMRDCRGEHLFRAVFPDRQYTSFADIPELVRGTLLYIEDRSLLDAQRPRLNPALDWARLGKAVLAQLAKIVDGDYNAPGGSTLATQVEKFRHSPDGVTYSVREKLRQMVSASVRAYRGDADTLEARRNLVLAYINTVPLSAAPAFGEVYGLGDGLWVWFGADFDGVNRSLASRATDSGALQARGLALRQVLALMIAHRRPSYYLTRGREELEQLADAYLRLLDGAGIIDAALRDAALATRLTFRKPAEDAAVGRSGIGKGPSTLRARLAGMLEVSQYDLDRLDLEVASTLDRRLQREVDDFLARLGDATFATGHGLLGEHLLAPDKLGAVRYSFTLVESSGDGNRVRVQTDTANTPFDINEQAKLELGSTAKLRVLASYLEIVAELHQRLTALSAEAFDATSAERRDPLSLWARDYLARTGDRSLPAMLAAALERRFSASPKESFFTGGGVHRFNNFRHEDDGRSPTLREALQGSINLPFVRLMRELVRYEMYQVRGSTARLLEDHGDPRRDEYLARFADREGQEFLRRFWRKHRNHPAGEMQASIFDGLRRVPDRLAAAYRYLNPQSDLAAFGAFINDRMGEARLTPARVDDLYRRFRPDAWDLADQGYLARVHPLELWLVGYLSSHPAATFAELVEASRTQRQAVYKWLFKTRAKNAQDKRILSMLEVEAFLEIHRRWTRLGYPFDHLVPSLATALGSSGDRPAALAALMGVIVNDGRRLPTQRITELHFAAATPYETHFRRIDVTAEQVMLPEVARALREALGQVVEAGTARRLAGVFRLPDGTALAAGGKTGTGDNRIVTSGEKGRNSVALNRTATFVFYLGQRHYGTLTAYVTGSTAGDYRFTSALPVQILKEMAPILRPWLDPEVADRCEDAVP